MSDRAQVLVCDDEPHIVRALKIVLREAGFEALPAGTAAEALQVATLRAPDAAILDLVLPDGDGVAVCRSLRLRSCTALSCATTRPWSANTACMPSTPGMNAWMTHGGPPARAKLPPKPNSRNCASLVSTKAPTPPMVDSCLSTTG